VKTTSFSNFFHQVRRLLAVGLTLAVLALALESCKPLRTPNDDGSDNNTEDPIDEPDDGGNDTGDDTGGGGGNNVTETWTDLTWDGLNDKRNSLQRNDLFLVDVEPYRVGRSIRYAAVWFESGSGDRLYRTGSWTDFQEKWDDYAGDNYRLIDLEVYKDGNNTRILGVWRQRDKPHIFRANFNWVTFLELQRDLSERGYRLLDVEPYSYNNDLRYAAVWEEASDEERIWKASSEDEFVQKWKDYSSQDLRLVDMEIYTGEGNSKKHLGIWREGDDRHKLWLEDTWDGFNSKRKTFERNGYQLIDIEVESNGGNRTYTGTWRFGKAEVKIDPEKRDFLVYEQESDKPRTVTKKKNTTKKTTQRPTKRFSTDKEFEVYAE